MKATTSENAKRMQKARDAASLVSYSPDYVSRLARQGKIVAEQRGRDWFVDIDSLKLFVLERQAEQRARHEELRQQRLSEKAQHAKTQLDASQLAAGERTKMTAGALTMVCLVVALLFGSLTQVAVKESMQPAQLWDGAASLFETVGEALPWLPALFGSTPQPIVYALPQPNRPAVQVTATGVRVVEGSDINDIFSDPVVVQHATGTTMTLEPVFSRETNEQYTLEITSVLNPGTVTPTP